MSDKSLKSLDYKIDFNINENGLNKALDVEKKIDDGFKGIGESIGKIDGAVGQMSNAMNVADKGAKNVAEALSGVSSNAEKANAQSKGIADTLKNFSSNVLGGIKGVADQLLGISNNSNKASQGAKNVTDSFKNINSSGLGSYNQALDFAERKLENIGSQYAQQYKIARDLYTQYNNSVSAIGRESEATQKLHQQLLTAQAKELQLEQAVEKAGAAFEKEQKAASGVTDELKKQSNGARNLTNEFKNSFDMIGRLKGTVAGLGIGIGVGAGVSSALNTFGDYQQAMAKVKATQGDLSTAQFDQLSKAAQEAGIKTQFSATDAANAMYYLSSAGFDVNKTISALNPLLNLAASGDMDLSKASEMLTATMTTTGLEAKDLPNLIDQIGFTAQKTNSDVDQLMEGFKEVGGEAKRLHMSTAQVNAELGILANSGKKGASGGVALRNILLDVTAPQENVAKLFKNIGVQIADSSGKVRPFNDIMVQLKEKMENYSEATQNGIAETIAGKENIQAFNILLEGSGKQYEDLTGKILKSNGTAEKMAEILRNTLPGAIKNFKSSVEGVTIQVVEKTGLAAWISNTADAFAEKGPVITNELLYISNKVGGLVNFINNNVPNASGAIWGILGALAAFQTVTFVTPIIGGLAGAFENLGFAILGVETGTLTLGGAMLGLMSPAGWVALAVSGIVGAFIWWKTASKETKDAVIGHFYEIIGGIDSVINYAIDKFNWLAEKINTVTSAINKVPGIGKMLDVPQISMGKHLTTAEDYFKKKSSIQTGPGELYGYATGTTNATPGIHLVGENGPELLSFEGGEKVVPANITSSLLNQTASSNVGDVVNQYNEAVTDILPHFVQYGKDINTNMSTGIDQNAPIVATSTNNLTANTGAQLNNFAIGTYSYGTAVGNELSQGLSDSSANLASTVKTLTDKVIDQFRQGFGIHSPSRVMYQMGSYLMQGLVNGMTSKDMEGFIGNWIGSMTSAAGGAVSGNLSGWITTAMALTGVGPEWYAPLASIIEHESGGDPMSINLWDWNAQQGHPSKGLMQLIDENMAEHHLPGMTNIYDPVSNIAAGIRLIQHDYGSVYNVPGIRALSQGRPYVGYATGTDNATAGLHWVGENGPELVNFGGGETVLNNKDSMSLVDSIPYGNSGATIENNISMPINIYESKDPKATALEVEKVLRENFGELLDREMATIAIQLGVESV